MNAITAPTLVTPLDSLRGREQLLAAFRDRLGDDTCLDWTPATRALFSSDASLYRVVPVVVAQPRDVDELVRVARAALAVGLPITSRGAGTSIAGNAVGAGLVIDCGRHLNRVLGVDPDARTATVEPGVVQADLQRAGKPYGLRFGPDPSTSDRCTLGGMIGNNACGPRALGYGRTADNIVSLTVLTGTGDIVVLGEGGDVDAAPLPQLRELVAANLGIIRTQFGRFSRQNSGYALEHLLPEHHAAVERFFAGTEGTLGIVLTATVRLVHDAPIRATVALGYATMADAADDTPALLPFHPTAIEGLDARIIDVVRRHLGADAVPALPDGQGYSFVELVGEDAAEVDTRAQALVAAAGGVDGFVVRDAGQAAAIWQIRSDGAGLSAIAWDDPAYPAFEDAAVPVAELGAYLRDFEALLDRHGLHGLPYGHFGEGCVHCRIDFPLDRPGGTVALRAFLLDAGALVARHGGSVSGEHGDGRARSALLPTMYSPKALRLFADIKRLFDPRGLLNPGTVVDPVAPEADVRVAQTLYSPLRRSDPGFVRQVHQCMGTGKCLANTTGTGGVMCPSYQATGDQYFSTRGRARMLQEMVNGSIVRGWRAPELLSTLDLCLACKGCRRDCPSDIDMAALKSRVLHEAYRHRVRPIGHYTLGWLPRWGRLAASLPGMSVLANLALQTPVVSSLVKRAIGVDPHRPMPRLRPVRATRVAADALSRLDAGALAGRAPVAVWIDSFSDTLDGTRVPALLQVLLAAGFAPQIITEDACCGLTWITTGQHEGARAQLRRALDVLAPIAASGMPIVGTEPSCLSVWRSDAAELLPDDPRVAAVAGATKTLAELLATVPEWTPPRLDGHTIVAQPHCHQASVLGWAADAALLARTGARVVTVGGCCGLAGNFGVEQGHDEVSRKVFEHDLGPAIEQAGPDAIILADGFSCRKQVADLTGRQAMTLAQLLAAHL
ncbi:MAG: FAD-binding oxidoreductase [Propionibacteriaceae bacterium]|nr:FAD-binding oxidoreductase [Propionibacteriaceae bacterium]